MKDNKAEEKSTAPTMVKLSDLVKGIGSDKTPGHASFLVKTGVVRVAVTDQNGTSVSFDIGKISVGMVIEAFQHISLILEKLREENSPLLKPGFITADDGKALTPERLRKVVAVFAPLVSQVPEIIAIIINKDAEWVLENLGPGDIAKIVSAVLARNDLKEIINSFQQCGKFLGQPKPPTP